MKPIFQLFREFSDKIKFDEYLELLLTYLGSNLRDEKIDQLQEVVNEALEEGGAKMRTIMQEILDRGKKEGEKEFKLKLALTCIMKGMENREIVELTELDIEQIESLKAA